MSHLYLHIPFCKQACNYCNFHFSTSLRYKDNMLAALLQEMELQRHYLPPNTPLETIYIGGGTPSILDIDDIQLIFEQINRFFTLQNEPEITLEANPDDLTPQKLKQLAQYTPINRLSIGIQSFFDADLAFMRRAHNAQQANAAILTAQEIGFQNITIDLIYGLPTADDKQWEGNLDRFFALKIPHLSAYCLTVEPKTLLAHLTQSGHVRLDDKQAAAQYDMLCQKTVENGFLHYEISNFGQPAYIARHNTAYWQAKPYLGIGPSAHSYNQTSRQWNVANNARYIKAIQQNTVPAEIEILTIEQMFNEYLMTGFRTIWGCDLQKISTRFGHEKAQHLLLGVQKYIDTGFVIRQGDNLCLAQHARFLADGIVSDLMIV